MEEKEKSNEFFNKDINNIPKINFSSFLSHDKFSLYFEFLKICILIYLFIWLNYGLKKQKDYIKVAKSLLKIYSFENGKSLNLLRNKIEENEIFLDKYETGIFNNIKNKLISFPCKEMWDNQREFVNGIVRRFRPKKIVEIGVNRGCSSSIILNAIQDFDNSHLYSIDLSDKNYIGSCVKNLFPNLMSKWTLYKGNIAAKYMEEIGKDIDMVLIDSAHFEPGEILDFIIVLPFLSEEAIIVMHDIAAQITVPKKVQNWYGKRNEWAPYIIFNSIRGKTFLPSGKNILTHDIGAKKLDINQKQYFHDYFRVLGGQWQFFPKEEYINELTEYFKKYYDNDCLIIFNETVNFNRQFVRNNKKANEYSYNSD